MAAGVCVAEPELKPIFNGKDLSGWKAKHVECWTVKDGVLHVKNNEKQQGDILNTETSYKDFVFETDFKFGEGTVDSGILIRNGKDQIQIGMSGSLKRDMTASPYIPGKGYPVEAEGVKDLLKADDWNTLRVRAIGPKYTTWLNGKEVMNYTSTSAGEEGPVGLQLHSKRVMHIMFRNIRIASVASPAQ